MLENKDKQPQAEPYIVKSHDVHVDADYADWIADIKSRYRSAQVKASVKVNAEKLFLTGNLVVTWFRRKPKNVGEQEWLSR